MSEFGARRPFAIRTNQPIISFTFDDFPRSALLAGGAILKEFGAAGTYYASFGLMGKATPTGRIFEAEDIPRLLEQGHELGCHTFSHCHSWDTEPAEFEAAIEQNRAALRQFAPEGNFSSLAYPISEPSPSVKAKAGANFLCCRCGGQKPNVGFVDLNQASAFFLEKSRDNLDGVQNAIDRNRTGRGWLIFATHDISDQPTPFGCSPGFFSQVVEAAVRSGASIMTVAAALESLGAPAPVASAA